MTREEFSTLPTGMALVVLARVLFDKVPLEKIARPRPPLPPKYDMRIYSRGEYQWASETVLSDLVYWYKKAKASADGGGQYAVQDARKVKPLGRWLLWRRWYPDAAWSGDRENVRVSAAAPSPRPATHRVARRAPDGAGPSRQGDAPQVAGESASEPGDGDSYDFETEQTEDYDFGDD